MGGPGSNVSPAMQLLVDQRCHAMTTRSSGPVSSGWRMPITWPVAVGRSSCSSAIGSAMGASVRNFGMLWPIGQPAGELRDLARRSLTHWLEVLAAAGLWHGRTGSLHLAYREDEARVLEEFLAASADRDEPFEWLNPSEVRRPRPSRPAGRAAGRVWSPEEVCVDPREVIAGLPAWLGRHHGVAFRFEDAVIDVEPGYVTARSGRLEVGRVWVCSGDEMRVLFPELLAASGMVRCKLQMMRSQPFGPDGSRSARCSPAA